MMTERGEVRDTVFTLPHLHDCIIRMIEDMEKDVRLPDKKNEIRGTF